MSVRVMSWVFEHSQSRGNDRLVLLAIADRCDDDGGNCWKSTEKLAAKAKVSKRTAQRSIDRLVEMGELRVVERVGTTNMLSVLMEGGRQTVTPSDVGSDKRGGVKLTPRQSVTGDSRVQGGASPVSPDTSFSHPTTPQPPASGGRSSEHCNKHTRFRRACPDCQSVAERASAKPKWCGHCEERTRQREQDDGTPYRCPDCHPLTVRRTA